MKYILDPISIAGGRLKLSFVTNDGDASSVNLAGDWVLSVGKIHEQVEENGLGGIIRLDNMEIELFDRGGVFHDTIFASAITSVQCIVNYEVSGTDYSGMYGEVDLSTVEYESYFDNEAGTESHSVNFIIMSLLNKLSSIPVSDLITQVETRKVTGTAQIEGAAGVYWVKLIHVLDEIQKLAFANTNPPTNDIAQTYYYLTADAGSEMTFDDLYLHFNTGFLDGLVGSYFGLLTFFTPPTTGDTGSFTNFGNVYDLLKAICSSLICYPVFEYTPATDTFQLVLRQRGSGTVLVPADIGILKYSKERKFYGYRAFRVSSAYAPDERDDTLPTSDYHELYSPSALDATRFGLEQSKFDLLNYFHPLYDGMSEYSQHYLRVEVPSFGGFLPIKQIKDGATLYDSGNQFLLDKATTYWSNSKMYERHYAGVGIGPTDSVKILNRLPINGQNYSAIDIERDFVSNEKIVKWVLY